jgi:hypothetical protein
MNDDVIVVSDLDGTAVFRDAPNGGPAVPGVDLVPVEMLGERPFSFMTRRSATTWRAIATTGRAVVVSTRSVAQYRQMRLPGPPLEIAFAANGGQLIVDGHIDDTWYRRIRRTLDRQSAGLGEIWRYARELGEIPGVTRIQMVDDLFITARAGHGLPADFAAELADRLSSCGWRMARQGTGVYLLPRGLDKSTACRGAAELLRADRIVAGGDSWLDAEMLTCADRAIRPAHGELHDAGWTPDGVVVTASSGPRASEQIIDWYAAQLGLFQG